MHGLIVNQLRGYVIARLGRTAWVDAIRATGVPLPDGPPPFDTVVADAHVIALLDRLAANSAGDRPVLLFDFGVFLAPALMRIYSQMIGPGWRTLDVIEHVESHIHTVVRHRNPGASPPYLVAHRHSESEVEVIYTSPLRLCALAEGIVQGLAGYFGERVVVNHAECMLQGDSQCRLVIRAGVAD